MSNRLHPAIQGLIMLSGVLPDSPQPSNEKKRIYRRKDIKLIVEGTAIPCTDPPDVAEQFRAERKRRKAEQFEKRQPKGN